MKRKYLILIILTMVLFIVGCSATKEDSIENEEPNVNEEVTEIEIDRSEYLTGEVILDGNYEISAGGYGVIYFVPDNESLKILEEDNRKPQESYMLTYEDMSIVAKLPTETDIYKVKVKIEADPKYNHVWHLLDMQLTDSIGTVAYEGKAYETNEIDFDVKVKDRVGGLIVESVEKVDEGIVVSFAGEIEMEGYYTVAYDEMYGTNMGYIYNNEESYKNIPYIAEQSKNRFYFMNETEEVEELKTFSAFGKGVFKISNYLLIYNVGTEGRPVYLSEIVSLDEKYNNLFEFSNENYYSLRDEKEDFIIVGLSNYEEGLNYTSTDYYYVNKDNPSKIFLFNSEDYTYKVKEVINENEFILFTDENESIRCTIQGQGSIVEKVVENN